MNEKLLIEKRYSIPCGQIKDEVKTCLDFFLYLAPNVDNYRNIKFDFGELEATLLSSMFKGFYRCYKTEFSQTDLKSDEMNPNYTINRKCVFLYNKNKNNENEINCFIRHIRNAIAHGRVFFYPNDWIVFEDHKMRSENLSARIICQSKDFIKWKKELIQVMKKANENHV